MTVDVAAPVELYDALHAALLERTGGGFQVIEVWDSQAGMAV